MGDKWPIVRFADAPLEIIDGDRGTNYPKKSDFGSTGYCLFLNAGNVTVSGFNFDDCSFISKQKDEGLRKGKLQRQDIVITTRGTVGNVAYYDVNISFEQIRINSGMVIVRTLANKLLPRFLYLFIRSKFFQSQVSFLCTGSAQPQLPIRDINRIELPLPPLPVQRAIAHIIGTFDDKIELNRQMNETLEAMARALFKSWFVDFDPVHAKAAGRQPSGMDAETAKLFPSEFEDSDLGPIPKGWTCRTVGELGIISGGKQLERSLIFNSGPHPVFGGAGIMGYTSGSNAEGFLISVGRVGAYCGQFFAHRGKAWINNNASLIRPNDEQIAEWMFTALKHVDIDVIKKGAAQPFVSNGDIANLKLIWPGESTVAAFSSQLLPLLNASSINEAESNTLARVREELLPRLLSGALPVKEAADREEVLL